MEQEKALERLAQGTVWSDFCDRLREAGEKIVAAAPDDPLDQAEGLRYLTRLTQHFLRATIDESNPAIAQLEQAAGLDVADGPGIRLDKLESLLGTPEESSEEATTLLADLLSIPLGDRYARIELGPEARREVDQPHKYAVTPGLDEVGFADGFPLLGVGDASLADLRRRMGDTELPMCRFRPNVTFAGAEPFAEDRWRTVAVSGLLLSGVKRCMRCKIPTTAQSGEPRAGEHRNG